MTLLLARFTRLIAFLIALVAGLVDGCARRPDPRLWFIESYDNSVFTFQHDGKTFKALCVEGQENPCPGKLGIELVGHSVQPALEGPIKAENAWMYAVGKFAYLGKGDYSENSFTIISVTTTP